MAAHRPPRQVLGSPRAAHHPPSSSAAFLADAAGRGSAFFGPLGSGVQLAGCAREAKRFRAAEYIAVDEPVPAEVKALAASTGASSRFLARSEFLQSPVDADVIMVVNTPNNREGLTENIRRVWTRMKARTHDSFVCSSKRRSPSQPAACAEYDFQYDFGMERVTATLDSETLAKIRSVAGPRGVSSFLNEAARERLARLELRGLLDDLDAKHGPVPPEVRAEVAREAKRLFRAK